MAKAVKDDSVYGTMGGGEDNGSTTKVPDKDNESTQSPDVENAYVAPLHRKLKSRHLTMIAIGGMSTIAHGARTTSYHFVACTDKHYY